MNNAIISIARSVMGILRFANNAKTVILFLWLGYKLTEDANGETKCVRCNYQKTASSEDPKTCD